MPPSRVLRERVAAQSAMADVVAAQHLAGQQSTVSRFFGISPLTMRARSSYRGALGELLVGDVLENLGQRWDVLHDVPLTAGSLDHLLIGPAGVFTVRTANCRGVDVIVDDGALIVAGLGRDDILAAQAEADEAALLLGAAAGKPIRVSPMLVVVDPHRLSVRTPGNAVCVIASSGLEKLLSTAPPTMTGEDVAFVSDLADLDATWPVSATTALDPQQLHRDFGQIRSQVGTALVRRIVWATVTTVIIYVSVCGVIVQLVSIMMMP
ncbi:MAG: NERD domain-containing protein [Salinibacterium sp.]|nr:NERD domain-containing protein [Salinibacterium sp.]